MWAIYSKNKIIASWKSATVFAFGTWRQFSRCQRNFWTTHWCCLTFIPSPTRVFGHKLLPENLKALPIIKQKGIKWRTAIFLLLTGLFIVECGADDSTSVLLSRCPYMATLYRLQKVGCLLNKNSSNDVIVALWCNGWRGGGHFLSHIHWLVSKAII